MSKPEFFNPPGTEVFRDGYHFSQVVRQQPGSTTLKTSGQGGWDSTLAIVADPKKQIEQTLQNVLAALRAAESSVTWRDITSIRSYHTDLAATFETTVQVFKEMDPDHRPVWTCVGVAALAIPGMVVEFEAEAVV
ncbi:endoribonuclease L-PSP, partial [Microdochium bolleyi]